DLSGSISSSSSQASVERGPYTPRAATITITEYTEYTHPGTGKWDLENSPKSAGYVPPLTKTITCYAPTCQLGAYGDLPGGQVAAGGRVHVYGAIINPTRNPWLPNINSLPELLPGGGSLSLTYIWGAGGGNGAGGSVPLGSTQPLTLYDLTANPSISYQTVTAYPDYYGVGAIGPACSVTFPVYQNFNINPSIVFNNTDWENPTTISYTTTGNNQGPAQNVPATAFSSLTLNSTAPPVQSATRVHTYGTVSDPNTYNPPSIKAGDTYCANLRISPGNGWIGPGNLILAGAVDNNAPQVCNTVHNEPYVHIVGSDASAGGGFGTTSCSKTGSINTYTKVTGTRPVGSGAQLGALSLGTISGFSSANLRTATPRGSIGLSFSNTSNVAGGGSPAPALGGNLGSNNCVADYFAKLPASLGSPSTSSSIADVSAGPGSTTTQYIKPGGGTLTINGGSNIATGANKTVYVDGNVVINNNITYSTSGWTKDNVPSFNLIVKGNIYVQSGVTQLDGMYVAQPKGSSDGNIYTCGNGAGIYSDSQLLSNCRKQLLVNGGFVAQKIYLNRSFGSLRNSSAGETYSVSNKNCTDSGNTSLRDCSAEIFNFSPEMYLSKQALPVQTGPTTGKYDYITSLPPVL
ncbi:MAG TPA: hypothetical protein VK534_02185, partial [Methylomirabilota bacterium]|nr:hypothetical protein [Methylomirabilota bacterium]